MSKEILECVCCGFGDENLSKKLDSVTAERDLLTGRLYNSDDINDDLRTKLEASEFRLKRVEKQLDITIADARPRNEEIINLRTKLDREREYSTELGKINKRIGDKLKIAVEALKDCDCEVDNYMEDLEGYQITDITGIALEKIKGIK